MCYVDAHTASLAALDLSDRLAVAGRTRVDPDDVLDHLEVWEPGTLPASIRIDGAALTVQTSDDITPATRSLLAAYSASWIIFRVVECADAE